MTSLAMTMPKATIDEFFEGLMAARRGDAIEDTLAKIIASQAVGQGAMPPRLGLSREDYLKMLGHHFPAYDGALSSELLDAVDVQRFDEMEDLRNLLSRNCSCNSGSEQWMVDIVVAGCMGNDHLWQDLGLWNRADLSRLMLENFEPLALKNNKDMKWKKFLYKQLCETEGIYTCRAPSCEVCKDYDDCFGPEE